MRRIRLSREETWSLLLMSAIFLASSRPRLATPAISFDLSISPDKIAHFLVFGLLATSLLRIPRLSQRKAGWLIAALLAPAYGIFDELHQMRTPGRSVELADAIADACGAFLASGLYQWLRPYRSLLEHRPFRRRRTGPSTQQQPTLSEDRRGGA